MKSNPLPTAHNTRLLHAATQAPTPWASLPDDELVSRYKSGYELAAGTLFDRYFETLRATAFNILRDYDEAAFVVNEALLSVLQSVRSGAFDQARSFKAYLFRSVSNRALCSVRKARREIPVDFALLANTRFSAVTDDDPEDASRAEDRLSFIEQGAQALPKDLRDVFILRLRDVPFKDISARLGISINTATSRQQYAISRLRKMAPRGL